MLFYSPDDFQLNRIDSLNKVFVLWNALNFLITPHTAAGVVPCGGHIKSPRASFIVQIVFFFRSFEISKDIQSVQNTYV